MEVGDIKSDLSMQYWPELSLQGESKSLSHIEKLKLKRTRQITRFLTLSQISFVSSLCWYMGSSFASLRSWQPDAGCSIITTPFTPKKKLIFCPPSFCETTFSFPLFVTDGSNWYKALSCRCSSPYVFTLICSYSVLEQIRVFITMLIYSCTKVNPLEGAIYDQFKIWQKLDWFSWQRYVQLASKRCPTIPLSMNVLTVAPVIFLSTVALWRSLHTSQISSNDFPRKKKSFHLVMRTNHT